MSTLPFSPLVVERNEEDSYCIHTFPNRLCSQTELHTCGKAIIVKHSMHAHEAQRVDQT